MARWIGVNIDDGRKAVSELSLHRYFEGMGSFLDKRPARQVGVAAVVLLEWAWIAVRMSVYELVHRFRGPLIHERQTGRHPGACAQSAEVVEANSEIRFQTRAQIHFLLREEAELEVRVVDLQLLNKDRSDGIVVLQVPDMPAASRISILASDISSRALAAGKRGVYATDRFKDFPPDWPRKYLLRGSAGSEGWFQVKPAIRRMIDFHRINLMEPFRPPHLFHVIFCRNVMIYFNKPTQEALVNRFASCLEPGGYLLIGHSESLTGLKHPYKYVKPAVYRRPA